MRFIKMAKLAKVKPDPRARDKGSQISNVFVANNRVVSSCSEVAGTVGVIGLMPKLIVANGDLF